MASLALWAGSRSSEKEGFGLTRCLCGLCTALALSHVHPPPSPSREGRSTARWIASEYVWSALRSSRRSRRGGQAPLCSASLLPWLLLMRGGGKGGGKLADFPRFCPQEEPKEGEDAASSSKPAGAFNIWGVAAAVTQNFKAQVGEVVSSVKATDWTAELSSFRGGVSEETKVIKENTVKLAQHIPEVVAPLPGKARP